jgi:hypothetical protein
MDYSIHLAEGKYVLLVRGLEPPGALRDPKVVASFSVVELGQEPEQEFNILEGSLPRGSRPTKDSALRMARRLARNHFNLPCFRGEDLEDKSGISPLNQDFRDILLGAFRYSFRRDFLDSMNVYNAEEHKVNVHEEVPNISLRGCADDIQRILNRHLDTVPVSRVVLGVSMADRKFSIIPVIDMSPEQVYLRRAEYQGADFLKAECHRLGLDYL